jgi:HK97 family phage prohead protease
MKRELRAFELKNLEIRAEEGQPKKIIGYAAVFETLSEPMFGFREKIQAGAFAESIGADDIRALWNHDENYVLGRNRAGTLKLEEDELGLKIEITPPDAQWARDLLVSIERRDVSQMSFRFETLKDMWDEEDPQNIVRTLVKARLWDVSPVTFPAYTSTSANVRTYEEILIEHRAAESQADEAAKIKERKRIDQEIEREREIQLTEAEI